MKSILSILTLLLSTTFCMSFTQKKESLLVEIISEINNQNPVIGWGCSPISEAELSLFKKEITRESYDDKRLGIAKELVKYNCLSASQLKMILKLFMYDKSRKELAIFAFEYCSNPGSYYQIYDAFMYESSAKEVREACQTQNLSGNTQNSNFNNNYNAAPAIGWGCHSISEAELSLLKKEITKESYDDKRLSIAKGLVQYNCLTAIQLKSILKLFMYDKSRKELAIYAHPYCSNPGSFYQIYDVFMYESSAKEVREAIN